ncbi:hypothetical protein FACS1894193_00700 [Bacilli bacterium]|nr:hypothetical protein FACS1894193_00700 [Bacilli bacterium]
MSKIKYLLISRSLSVFSGAILPVIFPLLILEITSSLVLSGVFFMITMSPSILISPFIGVWIEKSSKKLISMTILLILAGVYMVEFLLLLYNGEQEIEILMIFSIIVSIFSMVLDLSSKVFFSEIVDKEELEKYNGIKSIIDNLSMLGAPILGTFLYALFGFSSVVFLLGLLYLLSFLLFRKIEIENHKKIQPNKSIGFIQEFREGINYIRHDKAVLKYFVLVMVLNFFVASSEEVINPGIVIQKYHLPTSIFGFVSTTFSLGVILSGIYIARNSNVKFKKYLPKLFIADSVIMILIGLGSILMNGKHQYIFFTLMLLFEVFLGFITILINVPMTSFFQSKVPVEFQSRFFSLFLFAANLIIPLGIIYTGFLAGKIGPDITYILNNIVVIVIVFLTFRKK